MDAVTSPSCHSHQKLPKPKERQVQGFRVLIFSTENKFPLLDRCLLHDIYKEVSRAACLDGRPSRSLPGRAQSRARLWRGRWRHRQRQDRAEEAQGAARRPRSSPGERTAGLEACASLLPVQSLQQHFPVRDLGPGEAGFLLRHCDVTARVGTGPRKTSSCTGPTLVQDTGSELSAVP